MALTLITGDYNKIIGTHTDAVIRATSNVWNVYPDFHYVVDIYPIGFTFYGGNQLRFFVKPVPNTGKMLFNLSRALKNVALPIGVVYSNMTTSYIYGDSVGSKRVMVAVSEFYNSVIQSSSAVQQFSIIYSYYTKQPIIIAFGNGGSSGVDTISNKYFNVGNNLYWRLFKRYATTVDTCEYKIEVYRPNGTLFQVIDNSNAAKAMSANISGSYPTAVYSIDNNFVMLSIPSQSLGTIMNNAGVGSYIKIYEKLNTGSFHLRATMKNVNTCNTEGLMLYFLNEFGQFEHYYFPIVKEFVSADKVTINIEKYNIDGDLNTFYDFSKSVGISSTNNYVIKTDLISDDVDYDLLKRLVLSPVVYCNFVNDNKLYAVTIDDNKYNVLKQLYDKINQIQMSITFNKTINQ